MGDLQAIDTRYLSFSKGDALVGFTIICGYAFGFLEKEAGTFGFAPEGYLKKLEEINE